MKKNKLKFKRLNVNKKTKSLSLLMNLKPQLNSIYASHHFKWSCFSLNLDEDEEFSNLMTFINIMISPVFKALKSSHAALSALCKNSGVLNLLSNFIKSGRPKTCSRSKTLFHTFYCHCCRNLIVNVSINPPFCTDNVFSEGSRLPLSLNSWSDVSHWGGPPHLWAHSHFTVIEDQLKGEWTL